MEQPVLIIDEYNGNFKLKYAKKMDTLTSQEGGITRGRGISVNSVMRRLTPVECERLQTVPDNYTNSVSDNQRYKMLGNGWTIDVISHIFSYIK